MNKVTTPSQYKERVLVSCLGISPAILMETLWALHHQKDVFTPTRVIALTTKEGKNQALTHLFGDEDSPGAFNRFCKDFDIDSSIFTPDSIHVLKDENGSELTDIITEEHNQCVADKITQVVKQLSDASDTAIHLSLAGGRKTMGYYAGYALSLFGREQDRLSHVLVEEKFEHCSNFYYPTPYDCIVTNRRDSKEKHNAKDARVSLAEIPFVRIRQNIPPVLLDGNISFNRAVEMANWDSTNVTLSFKPGVQSLFVNDLEVLCDDLLNLAFLKMVLDFQFSEEKSVRAMVKEDKACSLNGRNFAESIMFFSPRPEDRALDMDDLYDHDLIDILEEGVVHGKTLNALIGKTDDEGNLRLAITFGSFNPRISNVNKFIKENLGERLGLALAIEKKKDPEGGIKRLELNIEPNQYLNSIGTSA